MSDLVQIRRALISVSDKNGLLPLARALSDLGVEIVSTGGTAAALAQSGVKVIPVEQLTGMPEMMDGRVKTLHPAIHAALLARRDLHAHMDALRELGLGTIDLLCVNLYPFQETICKAGVTREEAIEQIDIGGPAMIRSAAKNHQSVTVITRSDQYDRLMNELGRHGGACTLAFRQELALAAFRLTTEYDAAIAEYLGSPNSERFPSELSMRLTRRFALRYGENPHQAAALYRDAGQRGGGVVDARLLHGKELSYNNILDAAAAFEAVTELSRLPAHAGGGTSAAVIVKHNNPCGAALAAELATAFARAYAGDPLAAFGGILALSRPVDPATAARICEGEKFLEVIVAPGFDASALDQLQTRWKNVRLLATDQATPMEAGAALSLRAIRGGALVQEEDAMPAAPDRWKHVAGPALNAAALEDIAFVWTIAKHLKSNAIAIGRNRQLLGAGCGCVDRLTACRIAIEKAGDRIRAGAEDDGTGLVIAASDAFFPFPDGPRRLIDAGVQCLIHPGGSKRDQETIELCDLSNVTCLITGVRHFRH